MYKFKFLNSKIQVRTQVKDWYKTILVNDLDVGYTSWTDPIDSVYGLIHTDFNTYKYYLVVETKSTIFKQRLKCDFNTFLDFLYQGGRLTEDSLSCVHNPYYAV